MRVANYNIGIIKFNAPHISIYIFRYNLYLRSMTIIQLLNTARCTHKLQSFLNDPSVDKDKSNIQNHAVSILIFRIDN